MNQESNIGIQEVKILVFTSIISADNPRYTEDVKQEIIRRHNERPGDWGYILEPTGEDKWKYMEILGS